MYIFFCVVLVLTDKIKTQLVLDFHRKYIYFHFWLQYLLLWWMGLRKNLIGTRLTLKKKFMFLVTQSVVYVWWVAEIQWWRCQLIIDLLSHTGKLVSELRKLLMVMLPNYLLMFLLNIHFLFPMLHSNLLHFRLVETWVIRVVEQIGH